ncbi:hypothetical protein F5ESL0259_05865 [Lactobacillus sp. ESL0259]|nr:hypothetical protein F5ESL0259_05865 [Lactobacillus sp. ESL0259]
MKTSIVQLLEKAAGFVKLGTLLYQKFNQVMKTKIVTLKKVSNLECILTCNFNRKRFQFTLKGQ